MAYNWKVGEAIRVIKEGKDRAAMLDIGKRFPLFSILANGDVNSLVQIIEAVPEYITTRKIEAVLKADAGEFEMDEEAPAKPSKPANKVEGTEPSKRGRKPSKPAPEPDPDEDDDYDDDYEEEVKQPTKRVRKPKAEATKPAKSKPAKSKPAPVEEDDDDDWDI